MTTSVLNRQLKKATADLTALITKAKRRLFVLETLASRQEISSGKTKSFKSGKSLVTSVIK